LDTGPAFLFKGVGALLIALQNAEIVVIKQIQMICLTLIDPMYCQSALILYHGIETESSTIFNKDNEDYNPPLYQYP